MTIVGAAKRTWVLRAHEDERSVLSLLLLGLLLFGL
jgi:hypothetical protein